ncbi:MAG: hypothetical protein EHM28_00270 [Spirochaetaceae bacterium]|nr:MAG: hypothetical protein EHM28_00270 [Spirochaetaceae bacterium]
MKITGIDEKKCAGCGLCIQACIGNLYSKNGKKAVDYADPNQWCTGCGHCIAACPENAITYEAHEKALEIPGKDPCFEDASRLLMGKRTERKYKDKDISRPELEKILEVIRYAPSGHNAQPCEYIIIKDRAVIKMLADITIQSFKAFKTVIRLRKLMKPFIAKTFYDILNNPGIALGMDDMISQYETGKDVIFFNAPVVMVVHVPDMGALSYVDPGIAMTHAMLAAHSLGIGSCWMGFAMMAVAKHKRVLQALGIPKDRFIAGITTLGYPVNKYLRLPVRNAIKAQWM